MVGAGFALAGLALYALFMVKGKMPVEPPRALKLFPWAIALPYVANTAGWLMTEIGRAPWVVYGLMKLEDAVSTAVSSGQVLVTLIGFTLIYGALMVATAYLLAKYAKTGPATGETLPDVTEELAPSLVQD